MPAARIRPSSDRRASVPAPTPSPPASTPWGEADAELAHIVTVAFFGCSDQFDLAEANRLRFGSVPKVPFRTGAKGSGVGVRGWLETVAVRLTPSGGRPGPRPITCVPRSLHVDDYRMRGAGAVDPYAR